MDTVDTITRSKMMAAVKSKNTSLEVKIRHRLFRLGYRYRLHMSTLPGKPDLVFPKYRTALFIHGCFWHRHDCSFGLLPKTRHDWWKKKLTDNRKRDIIAISKLQQMAWRTIVVWECSLRASKKDKNVVLDQIAKRVERYLLSNKKKAVISGPIKKGQEKNREGKVINGKNKNQ